METSGSGRLAGKVALITGAGSGIGRGMALAFAAQGARVGVLDQNEAGADETVRLVAAQSGESTAFPIVADVSRSDQVAAAVREIGTRFGQLDILCNNAGIFWAHRGDTLVTEMDEGVFDHVIAVNLKSVFLCCKYGIPLITRSGGGAIINVASIAGLIGRDTAQAYVASKGGVIALTRTLAVHYAPERIRANVICPGRIDTPLVSDDYDSPEERTAFERAHLVGRFGTAQDIAMLAVYLASDESSFVTGAVYTIDGGYTAV